MLYYASRRQHQGLLDVSVQGPSSKLKASQEPESIYPGTIGAIPGACNVRPHEPRTPMPRAPREESSDSTHFLAKRQRDKKSQFSNSMRARLGPQEPGRSRPPMATTWAPRPDPMATPMVQNVHPHRDPIVTPVMRNVHSHPSVQQAGGNLPNEPPIGSISRRLDDILSTPFCSHIIHYEPPRGFLVPKFSTYDGINDPFRSHHALSTAHDARYWQRCTTMQSVSRQPTRTGPLMVSSPTSQFCWQFQGPVRSFRGTILVLRSTQAKYQHPAEHKNAR
ncbi:hypothetical protein CK203_093090 [Vitis vinifera]|uniref:Uncharacterized protein n=1 Tax=Vitis vinifera TaxID=29760 RepID=A0A438FCU4_VITVI|nr:hypothetical protein CK203_093090 [Vitis vinifera]